MVRMNMTLQELLRRHPVCPYIRAADFAVRQPWHMPVRRLLDYLFVYIRKGECLFTVNQVPYRLQEGDFSLMQPGDFIQLQGLTQTITPFVHTDLFYHPDREHSFPTKPGQIDLEPFSHLMQPRLNDLRHIEIPVRFKPLKPHAISESLLTAIEKWQSGDVFHIWEAHQRIGELFLGLCASYSAPLGSRERPANQLEWFRSYFLLNMSEPITVERFAEMAGLSVSRFSKLFKQTYGDSPSRYMMKLRLSHAEELLEQSDFKLDQIAAYCGFADIHHFSKAFKKAVGLSPGKFRTNRKQ